MKALVPETRMNTLVDGFGRKHTYLRISVTDKCNLRCFYCMPLEGIVWKRREELLDFEEIVRVADIFVRKGIDKIRLTGGEPLMRRDLHLLVEMLSKLEGLNTIAMTTNATLLAENAQRLKDAGITQLNISIDSFKQDRFQTLTGRDDLQRVMRGIEEAQRVGFSQIKLNVVAIAGVNEDEIIDFVDYVKDTRMNVRFIEFMPFRDNDWNVERVLTYAEMLKMIGEKFQLVPIETEPSAVAKDFSIVGHSGTVSFITSMSESFCSTCNRIRLTADGSIKSCLFYPAEVSLRDRIRAGATDADIEEMIMYSLGQKPEAHPPAEEIAAEHNRSMIEIGG
ncbi:GTP 3',8-cyclase MoaA [Candidatus Obscuribacterales bacterium]|nr:GTP 3',8-cyclase MoaA [Candidatus Obscuribacterales bacterium]